MRRLAVSSFHDFDFTSARLEWSSAGVQTRSRALNHHSEAYSTTDPVEDLLVLRMCLGKEMRWNASNDNSFDSLSNVRYRLGEKIHKNRNTNIFVLPLYGRPKLWFHLHGFLFEVFTDTAGTLNCDFGGTRSLPLACKSSGGLRGVG